MRRDHIDYHVTKNLSKFLIPNFLSLDIIVQFDYHILLLISHVSSIELCLYSRFRTHVLYWFLFKSQKFKEIYLKHKVCFIKALTKATIWWRPTTNQYPITIDSLCRNSRENMGIINVTIQIHTAARNPDSIKLSVNTKNALVGIQHIKFFCYRTSKLFLMLFSMNW